MEIKRKVFLIRLESDVPDSTIFNLVIDSNKSTRFDQVCTVIVFKSFACSFLYWHFIPLRQHQLALSISLKTLPCFSEIYTLGTIYRMIADNFSAFDLWMAEHVLNQIAFLVTNISLTGNKMEKYCNK